MEEVIEPVSKELIIAELTEDKRLRMTNKSNNQIYIITYQDSPNIMREIGRLREIAFRAAGGGTGLEKKHFKDAKATIEQVLAFNDKRRSTQNQLDKNLAEVNSLSKSIGQLMKEGKKEDAETAKARVAEIKETSKALQAEMDKAQEDMTNLLYTIPNVPYDSVPEGVSAEDNVVEKWAVWKPNSPRMRFPIGNLPKIRLDRF